jgi:hypothetical protein
MRIVLWQPGDAPVEAMSDGVSEPLTLEGSSDERWQTFTFKRPVPITSDNPPWAAVLVSRGEVTWSLGAMKGPDDLITDNVIRLGAPTGPWKKMPVPFQITTSPLNSVRGRIRVIGHAAKDAPVAPLVAGMGSPVQPVQVTPTPKGAAYVLRFSPRVTSPVLRVVSLVTGNVTLRDLDVVTTK